MPSRAGCLILISFLILLGGCADMDRETRGTAFVKVHLEEKHSDFRSSAKGISLTEAKTGLVVLRPPEQCSLGYAVTTTEYYRSLLTSDFSEVQMIVPLEVQLKMCMYFFSETLTLADLEPANVPAGGYGESEIFNVNLEMINLTVNVGYWSTFFSTLSARISSISSVGLIFGTTGGFKLSDLTGNNVKNDNFTVSDNTSHNVTVSDLAYGSYTYQVEMEGFITKSETFNVANTEEFLDIKLTPNLIEPDWVSFDNLSVSQVGNSALANAAGTLVIQMPLEKKGSVTQIICTMEVENNENSNKQDVTPPSALPEESSINADNVTYRIDFSTPDAIALLPGSNTFDVIMTIDGKPKPVEMGTVSYDACVDPVKMCFKLTWADGDNPDLHSYYFPEWKYQEETGLNFDNDSRGRAEHIYYNVSESKNNYTPTADQIIFSDGVQLPGIKSSGGNLADFTASSSSDTLHFSTGADLSGVNTTSPVNVSSTGTLPGGLNSGTIYYLHAIDPDKLTMKLADNVSAALKGTSLDLTDAGIGTHTLTALGSETQIWATNDGVVGDGTYLVWVEDVTNADLQGVRVALSGPGLDGNLNYGPFRFKDDLDASTTEAQNLVKPYQQPVFFIQVDNGTIRRSDNISVGDNLSDWNDNLSRWIGTLEATSLEQ